MSAHNRNRRCYSRGPDQAAARVVSAVERLKGEPCIVCGARGVAVGIWSPSPAANRQLGTATGHHRMLAYAACDRHANNASLPAIEAVILAEVRAAISQPDAN